MFNTSVELEADIWRNDFTSSLEPERDCFVSHDGDWISFLKPLGDMESFYVGRLWNQD